jgi:hypothetical protein
VLAHCALQRSSIRVASGGLLDFLRKGAKHLQGRVHATGVCELGDAGTELAPSRHLYPSAHVGWPRVYAH